MTDKSMSDLEQTKKEIRSVLTSCGGSSPLRQLCSDYESLMGYKIPFAALGFLTLTSFLQTLTDTVRVQSYPLPRGPTVFLVRSDDSAHIQELVSGQRKTRSSSKTSRGRPQSFQPQRNTVQTRLLPQPSRQFNYPTTRQANYPATGQFNHPTHMNMMYPTGPRNYPVMQPPPLLPPPPPQPQLQPHPLLVWQLQMLAQIQQTQSAILFEQHQLQLIQRLQSLQIAQRNCIQANEMQSTQPATVPLDTNTQTPAAKPKENDNISVASSHQRKRLLLMKVDDAEVNVASDHETSVHDASVHVASDHEALGASKSDHEFDDFDESPENVSYSISDASSDDNKTKCNASWSNGLLLDINDIDLTNPSDDSHNDPVSIDAIYPPAALPSKYVDNIIGAEELIIVCELISPSKFWIHLTSQYDTLTHIMDRLKEVFGSPSAKDLLLEPHELEKGQLCAVLHKNVWHRGEIESKPDKKRNVNISLVDYGSAMTTQSTKVYALTKELAAYPVQAFDAYLTKIEPLNGNWSKDAVQHFVQMVDEKFLYARFRELQAGPVVGIELIDTSNEQDVFIKEKLIKLGFARCK